MSIFQAPTTATFFPRRAIGEFTATVVVDETSHDGLEVTQHPVQQGASITDHAFVKPATVSITAMWDGVDEPLEETYEKLLKLQASRDPFDIVTGKRVYRNMLFTSLSVTTDAMTENALSVYAEFVEVLITTLAITSVPSRDKQKNAGKTGATQRAGKKSAVEEKNPERKRSALQALAG